jgi:hypothetical protein
MQAGTLKAVGLAISVALAALALVACGSGDGGPTTQQPALSAPTANRLATLSERVASDLDSGDTCHAAHAADDLRAAVESANLPASMRSGVDDVTGRLVDEVNCPPPPPPPPQPKQEKHKSDQKHSGDHQGDQHDPSGHSGGLPPGKAKLKGEEG